MDSDASSAASQITRFDHNIQAAAASTRPVRNWMGSKVIVSCTLSVVVATMAVLMRAAATMAVRTVGGQIDDLTVAHAALGDNMVGKPLHVGAAAHEHGDFETIRVVEMHMQRRLRQIVA
jgi:hypothetical protein